MIRTLLRYAIVTTLVAIILAACTPTVRVPITHPPEIDLSDTQRIAIGEITGPAAEAFASDLTAELFESGRFELLDRQHLSELVGELRLSSSGIVDESTVVELGGLVGNTALIFGNITNHRYSEESSIGEPKMKDGDTTRTHTRVGTARVAATLQLTDLRTGRIIAAKRVTGSKTETRTAKNRVPSRIDAGALLGKARIEAVHQFATAFSPHTTYEVVRFEKSDAPGIERGLQLVESGDLAGAVAAFRDATELSPTNAATWFNLGVTLMAQGEYDLAINALTEAHRIDAKTRYASEIARARRLQGNTEREDVPDGQ